MPIPANSSLVSGRVVGSIPGHPPDCFDHLGHYQELVGLVPSLEPGRIVVMDNLGAHRPKRVRALIEEKGCQLVYLPAYSPDYNLIEEAFAKTKYLLRKASARTKEALVEAIGAALSAVSAADARAFFEHAGYRPTAHLL